MSGERKPEDPSEFDLLAPWRAVDRLDDKDAAAFDRLLGEDPDLARRLDVALEERDAVVELNEALPAASAAARDRLFDRIAAEEMRRAPLAGFGGWLARRLGGLSPGALAWGATAAALLIAVQAGVLSAVYMRGEPGSYTTASHGDDAPLAGQTALVGFAPQATAGDIAKLLGEVGAEIVGGPKPGGVFVVRIAERRLEGAELDAALKRLQDRPGVVAFAAPGDAR